MYGKITNKLFIVKVTILYYLLLSSPWGEVLGKELMDRRKERINSVGGEKMKVTRAVLIRLQDYLHNTGPVPP